MKKNRTLRNGLILFLVLAALGLAGYFGLRAMPGPIPPSPVQVILSSPLSGSQVYPGDPVEVRASILADESIVRVVVWVDGQIFETQDSLVGIPTPMEASWMWMAGSPGPHVLVARAVDGNGRIGQSTPMLVTVLYRPPVGPYTTRAGESIESIAAKFNLPASGLGAANPGIDPTSPLPAGQQINLPSAPESPTTPPPPAGQQPGNPPGKLAIAFSEITGMITGGFPPIAPKLAIGAQGCQVKLVITPSSDDALGYTIFGLQLAAQNYVKLADIGPGQDPQGPIAWLDPQPLLTNMQYYVVAFNAVGASASNFVSLESAANAMGANGCFSDDGNGKDGVTELPVLTAEFSATVPVDQSYCYLSNNGGDWFRYPDSDFQFVQEGPLTGLETYLKSGNAQGQFQAQCWGWQGGELNYLGYASAAFPPNPANPIVVMSGEGFDLTLSTGIQSVVDTQPVIPGWLSKIVTPPVNLRPAGSVDVCAGHNGYKISPSPCNQLAAGVQSHNVLVWDWEPMTCWGTCKWNNNIAGFRIFQYKKQSFAKPVPILDVPVGITAAAIPIPWAGAGDTCYIVKAYADGGGSTVYSPGSNSYCPGDTPLATKTANLSASDWITTTDIWSHGDCLAYNDTKGMWDDQVMVGLFDGSYSGCDWDQRRYDAAVKFDLQKTFPIGVQVSVQKATLNFNMVSPVDDSNPSANVQPLCATDLGYERLAWEDWDPAAARAGKTDMLSWGSNASPYLQLQPFGGSNGPATRADVTQAVIYWLANPQLNHGFVLWTDTNDLGTLGIKPSSSIYYCRGRLWGFTLEIQYYDIP